MPGSFCHLAVGALSYPGPRCDEAPGEEAPVRADA